MSSALPRLEYGLWHYVWKLLRLGWLITFNNFRRARRSRQIGTIILALVVLAVLAAVFAASMAILSAINSTDLNQLIDPVLFLPTVPVLIFTIAFISVLLFSFGLLLQALYLAGDMDFLLSAPVPIRAVFVTKLFQAILPNFGMICLFGLPVLYGLGAAQRYHMLYYPLVVIVLVALVLAAAGLASLLVMSIVRFFPARRIAEVLGLIGGMISLLFSQLNLFTKSAKPSPGQISQALSALTHLNAPWSPLAWAGRGLVNIGEGRWLSGIGYLLLTLGLTGAIFMASLVTAECLYCTGWARMQSGTRKKKTARASRPRTEKSVPLTVFIERIVPAAVRGLIVKDALVLRRDLRNMSQLISPLILGAIYAVVLVRGGGQVPAGRGEAPAWFMETLRNALVYGNVGISLFVGWALMSRLAMMGFSQEGKQYWPLKTAPMSAGKLLAAKFLVSYLPTLVLSWGFLLAISLMQGASLDALLFAMPVVALCIAGGSGINLSFGVASANLEWDDPRHMMPGTAGCIGTIVSAGYMVIILALFFGPPIGFALMGWPEGSGRLIGLALGGAASLACAVLPPLLVSNRVPGIGES